MTKGSTKPGEGIKDADFVFYISAMQTERCQKGMTVAYAAHCQQESALDRFVHYLSYTKIPNEILQYVIAIIGFAECHYGISM